MRDNNEDDLDHLLRRTIASVRRDAFVLHAIPHTQEFLGIQKVLEVVLSYNLRNKIICFCFVQKEVNIFRGHSNVTIG